MSHSWYCFNAMCAYNKENDIFHGGFLSLSLYLSLSLSLWQNKYFNRDLMVSRTRGKKKSYLVFFFCLVSRALVYFLMKFAFGSPWKHPFLAHFHVAPIRAHAIVTVKIYFKIDLTTISFALTIDFDWAFTHRNHATHQFDPKCEFVCYIVF